MCSIFALVASCHPGAALWTYAAIHAVGTLARVAGQRRRLTTRHCAGEVRANADRASARGRLLRAGGWRDPENLRRVDFEQQVELVFGESLRAQQLRAVGQRVGLPVRIDLTGIARDERVLHARRADALDVLLHDFGSRPGIAELRSELR